MTRAITNPTDMSGKTILITGASSGLGRDAAILLSQLGARIVMNGRDERRLADTHGLLHGDGHVSSPYDMNDVDGILPWLQNVSAAHGPLDGFAHFAGIQIDAPLRLVNPAIMERLYRVNTISAVMLLRGFQSPGVHAGCGSVVFVSSTAARTACVSNGPYGGTKAALEALARTFSIELLGKRIRVNCVVPALVETEMAEQAKSRIGQEAFDRVVQAHPLGLGRPRDISNAVAFLLSNASSWITGSTLIVDGGFTIP